MRLLSRLSPMITYLRNFPLNGKKFLLISMLLFSVYSTYFITDRLEHYRLFTGYTIKQHMKSILHPWYKNHGKYIPPFVEVKNLLKASDEELAQIKALLVSYENVPVEQFMSTPQGYDEWGNPDKLPVCRLFPSISTLHYSNGRFQVLKASFGSVNIRSCHLTERTSGSPIVQCITYVELSKEYFKSVHGAELKVFLRLGAIYWTHDRKQIYEKSTPSDSVSFEITKRNEGKDIVFSFEFPENSDINELPAMSLTDPKLGCVANTNGIKINHLHTNISNSLAEPQEEEDFVVCAKDLFLPFDDESAKLTEWFEMVKLLGASHVFMPLTGEFQHPNVELVIKKYVRDGFLTTRLGNWPGRHSWPTGMITLARNAPENSSLHRLQESLLAMDSMSCILDAIGRYKYAVVLGSNELILPKGEGMQTWQDVMSKIPDKGESSVCFPSKQVIKHKSRRYNNTEGFNVDLPTNTFFLNHLHTLPADLNSPVSTHCIHNLAHVKEFVGSETGSVNCYHGSQVTNQACKRVNVDPDLAECYEYTEKCFPRRHEPVDKFGIFPTCELSKDFKPKLQTDSTILKYTNLIEGSVKKSLVVALAE